MNNSDIQTTPVPAGASGTKGERIAKIGAIVSAIMASACCWLPLVLLALGVSGASIATTLEAYRPVLVVVTFGFLGAAFYFTYRPRKAAEAGHGCCAAEPTGEESCCAPANGRRSKGGRRFNMMVLNKVMLWVVAVLALAFLFFPTYVGVLFGIGDEAVVGENMNRAIFQIEGMTCEGCATTVAKAIRRVPGVVAVEVRYSKKQAIVGTDPGHPVPKEEILKALKKAGYTGMLMGEEEQKEVDENVTVDATWDEKKKKTAE